MLTCSNCNVHVVTSHGNSGRVAEAGISYCLESTLGSRIFFYRLQTRYLGFGYAKYNDSVTSVAQNCSVAMNDLQNPLVFHCILRSFSKPTSDLAYCYLTFSSKVNTYHRVGILLCNDIQELLKIIENHAKTVRILFFVLSMPKRWEVWPWHAKRKGVGTCF